MAEMKKKKPGKIEMLMDKGAPSAPAGDEMDFAAEEGEGSPEEESYDAANEGAADQNEGEAVTPDEMQKFSDDELLAEFKKRGLGAKDLEMGSEAGGDMGSSDYAE